MKVVERTREFTVLAGWTAYVVRGAQHAGLNPTWLLEKVGISMSDLKYPERRLSYAAHQRLWPLIESAAPMADVGLVMSEVALTPDGLDLAGYVFRNCENLGALLQRWNRYSGLVNGTPRELSRDSSNHTIMVAGRAAEGLPNRVSTDHTFATYTTLTRRWLTDPLKFTKVLFAYDAPADRSPYKKFFRAPVGFGHPANELWFPSCSLKIPLKDAQPRLTHYLESAADTALEHLDGDPLLLELRRYISKELCSTLCDLEHAALALKVSRRTLQRRLRELGTSYQAEFTSVRHKIACEMLTSEASIQSCAHRVGFSDPSSFTRAFQRWEGVSPSEFRAKDIANSS